jgi:hypothetical protein
VLKVLENPADVWAGVFDNQLDDIGRQIVTWVVYNDGRIAEDSLWQIFLRARKPTNHSEALIEFQKSLKTAVGAILNRTIYSGASGKIIISLFNPSVGDYIIHRFSKNHEALQSIFKSLETPDSLIYLQKLRKSGIVADEDYRNLIRSLAEAFPSSHNNILYVLKLARYISGIADTDEELAAHIDGWEKRLQEVNDRPEAYSDAIVVMEALIRNRNVSPQTPAIIDCVECIMEDGFSEDQLAPMSSLVLAIDSDSDGPISARFREEACRFWEDNIDDLVEEYSVIDEYTHGDADYEDAHSSVHDFVTDHCAAYSVALSKTMISEIVDNCDISNVLENNMEYDEDEDGDYRRPIARTPSSTSEEQQVEDLFERS